MDNDHIDNLINRQSSSEENGLGIQDENDESFNDTSFGINCEDSTFNETADLHIDPDDFQKIHENLKCTVTDAMLIIYIYVIRHNLNWNAKEDLVHLVNTILKNDVLSPTKYAFKKKPRKFVRI